MRSRIDQWLRTPPGRLRAPWRLLAVGVAFLLVTGGVTVAALAAGLAIDPTRASGPGVAAALGVLVANGVAATLLVLAAARYLDRRVLADVGWRLDARPRRRPRRGRRAASRRRRARGGRGTGRPRGGGG